MLLSNLAEILELKRTSFFKKNNNTQIKSITANSKLIKKNSIFVVNSKKNIKKEYIIEAIEKGAIAIF